MCIGGAQIYKQFLEHCDRVYLTVVEENFEGDSNFPKLDEKKWARISTKRGAGTDTLSYRFEVWERQ
jgi:dihydrofolate reductase